MTELIIPEWLVKEAPEALSIWQDAIERLKTKGRLVNPPPEAADMIAAYAYCMARAAHYENVPPELVKWNGSLPPVITPCYLPKFIKESQRLAGNPLVLLWREGARYAINQLGLFGPPKRISFFEILLEDGWDELNPDGSFKRLHGGEVCYRLSPAWEIK
jgi:hypothetical protein